MRTVEAKLAEWHHLYKELAQAQSRLAHGDTVTLAGVQRGEMEAEVARLQRDCDAALEAVQVLIHGRTLARAREAQRPHA
jgi:hypothetical protein